MALTPDQLSILPFGYLSGTDLMQFGAIQLLTKQYAAFPQSLQNGCNIAYAKITSNLVNRYDIKSELAKKAPLQGTVTAVLTAGALTGITIVTAGGKYATAPTVVIGAPGGMGTQAIATAAIDANGVLTGFNITAAGSGYGAAPSILLTLGLAPDPREVFCTQLTALVALRNVLGNMQNVSEYLMGLMNQAEKDLLAIRNAQLNLELAPVPVTIDPTTGLANPYPESDAVLVPSSFQYIG